jgi:hypothetical protein
VVALLRATSLDADLVERQGEYRYHLPMCICSAGQHTLQSLTACLGFARLYASRAEVFSGYCAARYTIPRHAIMLRWGGWRAAGEGYLRVLRV